MFGVGLFGVVLSVLGCLGVSRIFCSVHIVATVFLGCSGSLAGCF